MSNPIDSSASAKKPPSGGKPRWLNFLTTILALAALLLSGGAAVLAWQANSTAADTSERVKSLATAAAPAPADVPADPTPVPETPTTDPVEPTVTTGESEPAITAQTQFTVGYTEKAMRIPVTCNNTVYVDLDKPQVQTDSAVAEIEFGQACGNETPYFAMQTGIEGSVAPSEAVQPGECAELIPVSPLAKEAREPVRAGRFYCLKTSASKAQAAGIRQKMVVLSVTGVADDGTIAVRASAWDVPG